MSYVASLKLKIYALDSKAASARLNKDVKLLKIINEAIADVQYELKQAQFMEKAK